MRTVRIRCAHCGQRVDKDAREVNRSKKIGRPMYCNLSCSAVARNAPRRAELVVRTCPCGQKFRVSNKAKTARHCSRGCASHFSMNEDRRAAQRRGGKQKRENLLSPSNVLKTREEWKYEKLRRALRGRRHAFEYDVAGFVFDLALLDTRVLVEFDGPYHTRREQRRVDAKKDDAARANGFSVVRRPVKSSTVLAPSLIAGL